MSGYDNDRVQKISQIMPQFSKVAKSGDTVLMGLEGDPLFPKSFSDSRPTATINDIVERESDYLVKLEMGDGTIKEVSSMTLAADQLWEFDDVTFRNVMERQRKAHEPETTEKELEYRGAVGEDVLIKLTTQIDELKQELAAEKETSRNFHNTMIASMNEMASDICKLDSKGENTEFCRTLKSEYSKLLESRAEKKLNDKTEYRGVEEEFSADETDFF